MQTPLPVGATHTTTTRVGPEHTPAHLAPLVVLSTPEMIRLMGEASTAAAQSLLDREDKTTVGVHIDVSHESAARPDEGVAGVAELVTADGPRPTFLGASRCGHRAHGRR